MPERKKGKKPTRDWYDNEGRPPASTPNTSSGGTRQPQVQGEALNPPFDARMRRIGNPLHGAHLVKRGWIQNVEGDKRVNFLFNPAVVNVNHTEDPNAKNPDQAPEADDPKSPDYVSQSATGVELLYDRTYELFSAPKEGGGNIAATLGVFADVAAWYTFLEMIPEMPTKWGVETLPNSPVHRVPAYLFIGTSMPFYGFVSSLNVTYTHWTLNMIPQRAKISVNFVVLPKNSATPGPNSAAYFELGAALNPFGVNYMDPEDIPNALNIFGNNDYDNSLSDAFTFDELED